MSVRSSLANWNGVEMPLEAVQVSVMDRSFLFGDAIYEVIRVYDGRPFLMGEHLQRMKRSLGEIQIAYDVDLLEERCWQTLKSSGAREATLYLHVTRGVAPRTHHFPEKQTTPNALIYVKEIDVDPYRDLRLSGAKTILVEDLRWKRCDIKSVNLLANCLASQAAKAAGCLEAILVEEDGRIVECSHSSLFGVRHGALLTTPLGTNLLPGITRKMVVHIARKAGLPVREESIRVDDLSTIDELFLTGTTTEVMPIVQVDQLAIGTGLPGPVVNRLQEAYRAVARSGLSMIPEQA